MSSHKMKLHFVADSLNSCKVGLLEVGVWVRLIRQCGGDCGHDHVINKTLDNVLS